MKKLILLIALSATAALAQANTLYKCQGTDGRMTYTNQKGGNRNCTIISQDYAAPASAAPTPRAARQPTPADFPRVNGDQQKARDNDRRAILEQELAGEQKLLATARNEPNSQDRVRLHERNIEAIRKEIANQR